MKSLAEARLYTFVDTSFLRGRSPADTAHRLIEGGSDIIQLRAKGLPEAEVRRMAEAILPITRDAGVPLVLNDHWRLALALGCDFAHLGQEDFFNAGHAHVRELSAPKTRPLQIGLSTHAPEQARRALDAGPAYLAIGPVFPTATKPGAPPVTLDYVRWAAAHVTLPWFAIGGINLSTLDSVLEAGARRICVVSAILNAPDIARACQQFKERVISAASKN